MRALLPELRKVAGRVASDTVGTLGLSRDFGITEDKAHLDS